MASTRPHRLRKYAYWISAVAGQPQLPRHRLVLRDPTRAITGEKLSKPALQPTETPLAASNCISRPPPKSARAPHRLELHRLAAYCIRTSHPRGGQAGRGTAILRPPGPQTARTTGRRPPSCGAHPARPPPSRWWPAKMRRQPIVSRVCGRSATSGWLFLCSPTDQILNRAAKSRAFCNGITHWSSAPAVRADGPEQA